MAFSNVFLTTEGIAQAIKASLGDSRQHEDHAELHGKSHHAGRGNEAFWWPKGKSPRFLEGRIDLDYTDDLICLDITFVSSCVLYGEEVLEYVVAFSDISRLYVM